ncbi:MAG: DUF853 domain-containing protein [Chiayiivirga sp.]|nr:DUF853 domain-containing protein [Chiayiivirga sp.]
MNDILLGKGDTPVHLLGKYGNRHGLVAGATGTGKTVSLMTLAEGFSRLGVPVFLADVKGDVAGLAMAGVAEREDAAAHAPDRHRRITPTKPARWCSGISTASWAIRCAPPSARSAPPCSRRILELNDTQAGVLDIVFKLADDRGLLLLDLDDLRALLGLIVDERKQISTEYGLVSTPVDRRDPARAAAPGAGRR